MKCKGPVGFDAGKARIGDHCCSTGTGLLGGLKQQHHTAALRSLPVYEAGEAEQDGAVTIVTAQVALARNFGAMGNPGRFENRQGIEFRPEHQRRTRNSGVIDSSNAVATKTGDQCVGPCWRNENCHPLRRFALLAGKFGMAMKQMAEIDQFNEVAVA